MSVRDSAYREALIERLSIKQNQLTLLYDQYEEALSIPVEEYRFNSGEGGNQWARRRTLKQLQEAITRLENEIDNLNRRLRGGGLTNIVLRRRRGY